MLKLPTSLLRSRSPHLAQTLALALTHRRLMSVLPERMRAGGVWFRPDKRRPDYFLPFNVFEGNGEIYGVVFGDGDGDGEWDRLRVVRKVGWANGSTVWLCVVNENEKEDRTRHNLCQKYVALKIETAFNYYLPSGESTCFEAVTKNNGTRGARFCLPLLAKRTLSSVHGDHRCFVTPVTGPDLGALAEDRQLTYSLCVVRRIVQQVLLALEHLHSCGFVHCDVKCDNVVVRLPDETYEEIIDTYLETSRPESYRPVMAPALSREPYTTLKSQPIAPVWLRADLSNLDVQLIDYGEARPLEALSDMSPELQLDMLRPPEITLGCMPSEKIDIWSVGLMVTDDVLLWGCGLKKGFGFQAVHIFTSHHAFVESSEKARLYRMIEYFGPFPESFLARCPRREELLNADGTDKSPPLSLSHT
ncbi:Serine/threonine-protein kinase SKY1 [Termitomyces sp. J132]|nr:Serine/threonine-protein kinase SKY1 [Termitomyces sp. J132]